MSRIVAALLRILIALSLAAAAFPGPAFGDDRSSSPPARADSLRRGGRWALLPIVFNSPDTRLAFGVLPQYIFYTAPGTRPSAARLDAYYTQNRQFHVIVRPQIWLPGNAWRLAGKWSFKKWPTSFYGIGTESLAEAEERFTERLADLTFEAQRQLYPGLFAGLKYSFRYGKIVDIEAGGLLEDGAVVGSAAGHASGIGALVSWDTRDNVNFPAKGSLFQASATFYGGVLGSDYRLDRYSLDLRQYLTLTGRHVLALQAIATLSTGELPFRMLPGVGENLRGYGSMRYIDNDCLVLQAEYRIVPIWWRLGLTVFGGVGEVAGRMADFSFDRPKWAVGIGLRFLLFTEERVTIRQDFAFGRDASGDYLDLNEAY
ncbi:MAG: BamA/TamA family outer membrane protein [Rhodothermales bacterium]